MIASAQIQYQTIPYKLWTFTFCPWIILKKERCLTIEPVDNNQLITDSEDEKVRKKNKCTVKRKTRLNNLHASMQAFAAGSTALSLPCLTLVSCPRSSAPLLSRLGSPTCLLPFNVCPGTSTALLCCSVPTPVSRFPAFLSPFPMLDPTTSYLAFTALRIFKQALSEKSLRRSTSPAKFFCPFPPFSLLSDKTNRK